MFACNMIAISEWLCCFARNIPEWSHVNMTVFMWYHLINRSMNLAGTSRIILCTKSFSIADITFIRLTSLILWCKHMVHISVNVL